MEQVLGAFDDMLVLYLNYSPVISILVISVRFLLHVINQLNRYCDRERCILILADKSGIELT